MSYYDDDDDIYYKFEIRKVHLPNDYEADKDIENIIDNLKPETEQTPLELLANGIIEGRRYQMNYSTYNIEYDGFIYYEKYEMYEEFEDGMDRLFYDFVVSYGYKWIYPSRRPELCDKLAKDFFELSIQPWKKIHTCPHCSGIF